MLTLLMNSRFSCHGFEILKNKNDEDQPTPGSTKNQEEASSFEDIWNPESFLSKNLTVRSRSGQRSDCRTAPYALYGTHLNLFPPRRSKTTKNIQSIVGDIGKPESLYSSVKTESNRKRHTWANLDCVMVPSTPPRRSMRKLACSIDDKAPTVESSAEEAESLVGSRVKKVRKPVPDDVVSVHVPVISRKICF